MWTIAKFWRIFFWHLFLVEGERFAKKDMPCLMCTEISQRKIFKGPSAQRGIHVEENYWRCCYEVSMKPRDKHGFLWPIFLWTTIQKITWENFGCQIAYADWRIFALGSGLWKCCGNIRCQIVWTKCQTRITRTFLLQGKQIFMFIFWQKHFGVVCIPKRIENILNLIWKCCSEQISAQFFK